MSKSPINRPTMPPERPSGSLVEAVARLEGVIDGLRMTISAVTDGQSKLWTASLGGMGLLAAVFGIVLALQQAAIGRVEDRVGQATGRLDQVVDKVTELSSGLGETREAVERVSNITSDTLSVVQTLSEEQNNLSQNQGSIIREIELIRGIIERATAEDMLNPTGGVEVDEDEVDPPRYQEGLVAGAEPYAPEEQQERLQWERSDQQQPRVIIVPPQEGPRVAILRPGEEPRPDEPAVDVELAEAAEPTAAPAQEPTAAPAQQQQVQQVEQQTAAVQPGEQPAQPAEGPLAQMPASDLLGANVVNEQGENIATVDDIVRRPGGPEDELYAVLEVGGFLGIGAREVAVPLNELEVGADNELIMRGVTQEQLEQMQPYERDQYQTTVQQ